MQRYSMFATRAHAVPTRDARSRSLFESGFSYSRKLSEHLSCINATAFSRGDGRWLASAGDDLRVLLWDFHQENVEKPLHSLLGHRKNIFCLDFSAGNQYLYTGATDEKILKYDLSIVSGSHTTPGHSTSPCRTFSTQEESVRGISCHPENDEIFLSASEDGKIALHDSRAHDSSSRPSGVIENPCEPTDIQYHPQSDKLFATSDSHGNVCLRDTRMAFDSSNHSSSGGIVLKYMTGISRRSVPYIVQPEASSLTFDREGRKLAVNFLHHLPTIYQTSDPKPLAVCSGRNRPDGSPVLERERTYGNNCTIKHGSFGGPGMSEDPYFTTGSDDFRGYVWKIPNLSELAEQRRKIEFNDWNTQESVRTIGYAASFGGDRYVPVELSTPLFRLQGHDSIVNNSIIHPHFPQIATSGVEKYVRIHNPSASAPNMAFERTSDAIRTPSNDGSLTTRNYLRALLDDRSVNGIDEDENTEEQKTIDFFDGIIRENEGLNVFTARNSAGVPDQSGSSIDEEYE